MNLVNQREKIKELKQRGIINTHEMLTFLTAPVFVWNLGDRDHFTEEQKVFIDEFICTGDSTAPTITPFTCFRISSDTGFMIWEKFDTHWNLTEVKYRCEDSRNKEIWLQATYSIKATERCVYACWFDGVNMSHLFRKKDSEEASDEGKKVFRSMLSWLTMFLYDIEIPGNTVLKTSPTKEKCSGKSVEWRLAREHYLIIGKKEAVQCRESKGGPTQAQIARGAHYRKAYYRLLSSPVFRHKRGQKIRVKDAWVGPEEWIGLDGKSYKVINLKQPD